MRRTAEQYDGPSALELLSAATCDAPVFVQAPMVRYSKLEFRLLVRQYGVDIGYTPMIVASTFIASQRSRDIELTMAAGDRPLVAQFAASTADEFIAACELVAGHVDAVDLNCGCPQRWAMAEGYGARMIERPDALVELIRATAARAELPVAVKMRVHADLRRTVELARRLEAAGAAWLTVHGRTAAQGPSTPVDREAIALVRSAVSLPLVANGDIETLADARAAALATGANGVMAARGLLANPTLFSGTDATPLAAVREYAHLALRFGTKFCTARYHLLAMCETMLTRPERAAFARVQSMGGVLEFLRTRLNLDCRLDVTGGDGV